jgi:hypothetical protein
MLPLELLADMLPLELVADMLPPQGLVTGMHTRTGFPSAVLTAVQAWPAGHAVPLVQSRAQYVSPANWAQSRPAPQLGVVTHPLQSTLPPPVPAVVEAGEPELVAPPGPDAALFPPAPTPALAPAPAVSWEPPVAQEAAAATPRPTEKKERTRALGRENFIARHGRGATPRSQAPERRAFRAL